MSMSEMIIILIREGIPLAFATIILALTLQKHLAKFIKPSTGDSSKYKNIKDMFIKGI